MPTRSVPALARVEFRGRHVPGCSPAPAASPTASTSPWLHTRLLASLPADTGTARTPKRPVTSLPPGDHRARGRGSRPLQPSAPGPPATRIRHERSSMNDSPRPRPLRPHPARSQPYDDTNRTVFPAGPRPPAVFSSQCVAVHGARLLGASKAAADLESGPTTTARMCRGVRPARPARVPYATLARRGAVRPVQVPESWLRRRAARRLVRDVPGQAPRFSRANSTRSGRRHPARGTIQRIALGTGAPPRRRVARSRARTDSADPRDTHPFSGA